jgi:phage terminase small subunit
MSYERFGASVVTQRLRLHRLAENQTTTTQGPLKRKAYEDFAQAYVATNNATKAAKLSGYSEKTAYSSGSRLLTVAEISRRIETLTAQKWRKLHMSPDEIRGRIAALAKFDPRKLYDDEGNLKAPKDWDDDTAYAINAIEADQVKVRSGDNVTIETITKKIKTSDKAKALELAAREQGMFEKDNKQGAEAMLAGLHEMIRGIQESSVGVGSRIKARKA